MKCLYDKGIERVTDLINNVLKTKKMTNERRKAFSIPSYKNKGNIQSCTNYSGFN